MCLHKKKIYNRYLKRYMFVKCGKCIACKQEKANKRKFRISNYVNDNQMPLFFTLTYSDDYCPYFYKHDIKLYQQNFISIYRYHDIHLYFDSKSKNLKSKVIYEIQDLGLYYNRDCSLEELNKLHCFHGDRIAVLYYSDIQKFFKRLRQEINRNEQFRFARNVSLPYFVSGEYGETFQRCHWHILLYVPRTKGIPFSSSELELWQSAVCKCWRYASDYVTKRRFEPARNPASYLSQYVNCGQDVSTFLSRDDFAQVWHYSKGFGSDSAKFSLQKILQSIDRFAFGYNVLTIGKDGSSSITCLSFPKFVINRFFPDFKGRFRLSYQELFSVVSRISELFYYKERLELTNDDLYTISVRLSNSKSLFIKETNLGSFDYAFYYCRCLMAKNSFLNNSFYEENDVLDSFQRYDNLYEIVSNSKDLSVIQSFEDLFDEYALDYVCDPNSFLKDVQKDISLNEKYDLYIKTKKLNSLFYGR